MNRNLMIGLVGLAMGAMTSISAFAGDQTSETRPLDAGVSKVYLGGFATLQLRQGATPSLVAYGDSDALKQLTTVQNGDALRIDTHGFYLHTPSVRIEMTLPTLTDFTSSGVGGAEVDGFSGEDLQLSVTGAGYVNAAVHYHRIIARASGVADVKLDDGGSESIDVALPGAGHMLLTGQTKNLICRLSGVGSLDAKDLKADAVTAYLNGVGSVKVYAKKSANMSMHGVGSATVYGNPPVRKAVVIGFGKVTWE